MLKFAGDPEKISKDFVTLSKEVERKKNNLNNTEGRFKGISQNLPKYSLTLDWLDCVFESTWLWWRCSSNKSSRQVGISSETFNSLAKFFNLY